MQDVPLPFELPPPDSIPSRPSRPMRVRAGDQPPAPRHHTDLPLPPSGNIGATTLSLLLWLPLTAYVAAKQVASLAITGAGIALTIDLSVRTARREGFVAAAAPPTGARAISVPAP